MTSAYEIDERETALLVETVRCLDLCRDLEALVRTEGLMAATSQGPRAHPALVELRQQRLTLTKLLAVLGIPSESADGRTKPRGGPRGVYGLGPAS